MSENSDANVSINCGGCLATVFLVVARGRWSSA